MSTNSDPEPTHDPASRSTARDAAAAAGGLAQELAVAEQAAQEASSIILEHYEAGSKSWDKSENDPVTQADLDADAAIRSRLAAAFPDDGILTEEHGALLGASGRTWIVDPMDGTREFVARVPEFAVSIALVDASGEPCVGIVENPLADIRVLAARRAGCWRVIAGREARVQVSRCAALPATRAIASRSETRRGDWDGFRHWFGSVRPMGSIAWKLSAVACAVGDLNVSVRPKSSWDVCAGDLLVREAGGIYVDTSGRAPSYSAPDADIPARMIAGNPALVEAFLARVAREPEALETTTLQSAV